MARFTGENLGRANGLWATITHGVIHVFLTGRPLRVNSTRSTTSTPGDLTMPPGLHVGDCFHRALAFVSEIRETSRCMADRFQDRRWLARVSGANGLAKGAAWAVDSEHLVTCAHVD
jgi:hypothetical protein